MFRILGTYNFGVNTRRAVFFLTVFLLSYTLGDVYGENSVTQNKKIISNIQGTKFTFLTFSSSSAK